MTTVRNKFHELGNWHNKMSLAAIVTKELLAGEDMARLSKKEMRKVLVKAVKNLSRIEKFVAGADGVVGQLKSLLYPKSTGDRPYG